MQPFSQTQPASAPAATSVAPPTAPTGLKVIAFALIILNTVFTIWSFWACMQALAFDPSAEVTSETMLYAEIPDFHTYTLIMNWAIVAVSLAWIAIGFALLRGSQLARIGAHVVAVANPLLLIASTTVMLGVFSDRVVEVTLAAGASQAGGNAAMSGLDNMAQWLRTITIAQQIAGVVLSTGWCAAIVFVLHTRAVRNFFAGRSTHDIESVFVYPAGYPAVAVPMPAAKRTGPKKTGTSVDLPTLSARDADAQPTDGASGPDAPTLPDASHPNGDGSAAGRA